MNGSQELSSVLPSHSLVPAGLGMAAADLASIVVLDDYGITTSRMGCAAIAFLVWDMLISFDREVEYIWRGPNGWVKWTFLLVRHVPYLLQGTVLTLVALVGHTWRSSQCRAWIAYQLISIEVLVVVVEVLLIVRVYAMYNRNRAVLILVLSLFVGEIVAMCTILALSIPKISYTAGCLITSAPRIFPTYWTISLAFETTLFALTLLKFFTTVVASQLRKQSILYILVRDGTWAYAIIFAVMLLNTLMYQIEHNTLAGVFYFWEISVMSFAGSHVLLNLRRLAIEPRDSVYGIGGRRPLSDMQFVHEETDITLVEMQPVPRAD
ncbi:hypothetical protein BD413DRAFT_188667 [Trametes elegans]|nr:hypothetical protein BD413DRAFT_188667 [Trametes elegans]